LDFIIAASTDKGTIKDTNEDSLFVRTLRTKHDRMVFAVLCDGMGGLSKGELASATVIRAFTEWMNNELPRIIPNLPDDQAIRASWDSLVATQNEKIQAYGKKNGITLGTTVTALLITLQRYYIMNAGDGRVYEIAEDIKQITVDQTVVERDVRSGLLTREAADRDPRRNVLLQCVGASETLKPDYFFGETKQDAIYMLCSDGFRHEITPKEIYNALCPSQMTTAERMKAQTDRLIAINKERKEEDNISCITIRTAPKQVTYA